MSYCNEHGIPHSRFLEWDPEDRAKAIAFALEKAQVCSMCGTAEWEWHEDRRAYLPVVEVCPGCQLKETMRDDDTVSRTAGAQVVLLPKAAAMPVLERQHDAEQRRRRRDREATS